MTDLKPTMTEIVKFLLGEGALDGHHFGEDFHGRPKFWWRTYLREALQAQQRTDGMGEVVEKLNDEIKDINYSIASDNMFHDQKKSWYLKGLEKALALLAAANKLRGEI
jgi:hypothetical protein